MMYELLSSMSPFDPPSNVRALLEFDEGCWEPLDPQAQAFVEELLAKKAEARGTSRSALEHPWLAAAAIVERGRKREIYAPTPNDTIVFHSMARVWEISGMAPTTTQRS